MIDKDSYDMKRSGGNAFNRSLEMAFQVIPVNIKRWLGCDLFLGADPVFAGLHEYEDASYDRSYRNTAHVAWSDHQSTLPVHLRQLTLVLPRPENYIVIVHELGHVLHVNTGYSEQVSPVSWYADTNSREAFAEAFTAWLLEGYSSEQVDRRTACFFEELSL